jgi:beta-glucosidase
MRHGTLALFVGLLLAAIIAAPASAAPSCPWMNTKLSANQRAHKLVSAMTVDQKIAMLSQSQPVWTHYGAAGFVPGQPSVCIPDLVLNDAGQGVGDFETNTTAFPASISQSSSWDPSLQWRFGAALGWQAWHKGINVQLAGRTRRSRRRMQGSTWRWT